MICLDVAQVKEVEPIHNSMKKDHHHLDKAGVTVDDVEIDIDNVCGTVEISSELPNEFDSIGQYSDGSKTEDSSMDPDQIQIKADAAELNRRIESFISRKREQVNMVNIQEFCTNRLAILLLKSV